MQIAIHTQHFLGVGHHVRMMSLARALARRHTVVVFDGGQPLPLKTPGSNPRHVPLPAIVKHDKRLVPLEAGRPLEDVFLERAERFRVGVEELKPDVVLTEFFPLSRWVFRREHFAGIDAARSIDPGVRVVSSLRDVPRIAFENRADPELDWDPELGRPIPLTPDEEFLDGVPGVLNHLYDVVLVHGDPRVTRLEDHFPWVGELEIPVHYTGYIRDDRPPGTVDRGNDERPLIVVSVGGDARGASILRCALQAWHRLPPGSGRLLLFAGAFMTSEEVGTLRGLAADGGAELRPFGPEFLDWLEVADLSISRVGYNTAVALLAAGVRSLLIPKRLVPDQTFRARRLQELGLARCLAEEELDPGRLAESIERMLRQPRPNHNIDLNGAERTREFLETLGQA